MATTVLLPNLMFGCSGTIVRLTIAVAHNYDSGQLEQSAPKIQIWKETESLYKSGPEIPISNSSCVDMTLNEGILQCTLNEAARVSVQPGDILGVEIPPIAADHNGYEILFNASSESTAHIFQQRQPSSTVNLTQNGNSRAGRKAAVLVISSIVIFILILLAVITILVVVIVFQRRQWKKQKQALNNIIDSTSSNLANDGELSL